MAYRHPPVSPRGFMVLGHDAVEHQPGLWCPHCLLPSGVHTVAPTVLYGHLEGLWVWEWCTRCHHSWDAPA